MYEYICIPMCAVKTHHCLTPFDASRILFLTFRIQSVFYIPFVSGHSGNSLTQGAQIARYFVCVKFCVPPYSQAPSASVLPVSTPPEDHPSTPTAPRVSVVPEESIYQSFTTMGQSPPPQPQRTAAADEADLQMIRARHSQGQPLPPYQTIPRDPASPERE